MKHLEISQIELAVLCHIANGLSDGQIAAASCRSTHTIQTHRDHLMTKTGCHNRVELTRWAIAHGHVAIQWVRI
jgi:DNA-binding NarL/FixJ family response regulator